MSAHTTFVHSLRGVVLWLCGMALTLPALAEVTPVGIWQTGAEGDHAQRAEIAITEEHGEFTGRITRMLPPPDPPTPCEWCEHGYDGKPLVGMAVITGVHKAPDAAVWEGGHVLDADTGKSYDVRLTLADGGQELKVRAFVGPLFRTQTWKRVH